MTARQLRRVTPITAAPNGLIQLPPRDPDLAVTWTQKARCPEVDPELFFPETGVNADEAKHICRNCPVQQECLDEALHLDAEFGIWGGLSTKERQQLKRQAVAA